MKNTLLSLAAIAALSISFTACGSDEHSASGSIVPSAGTIIASVLNPVEVERGKIYDAQVTDSSTPAKIATKVVGSNIYTFTGTPIYPIIASGGWIDIDGDGNMTTADILSDINLTSYSNVITPTTSYLGDTSSIEGKAKLDKLIADLNVSKEDLLKVPSKSSAKAILVANSIYQKVKLDEDLNMSTMSFDDLNSTFHDLENLLVTYSDMSIPELAIAVENQVVNTNIVSNVTKLDQSKIIEIIHDRLGSSEDTDDSEESSSEDSANFNPTSYENIVIKTNMSANAKEAEVLALSTAFKDVKAVDEIYSCTSLGYTFSYENEAFDVEGKYYTNEDKSCTELNYENSSLSNGTSYYTIVNNGLK